MTELKDNAHTVENRFEILFVYDVEEGNPNGDPLNEDRPRIDEETGENIVTDVRLKRTVRDFFIDQYEQDEGNAVFVRGAEKEDGTLKTRKELVVEELQRRGDIEGDGGSTVPEDTTKSKIAPVLFEQFIDLRLFGATLSVERSGRNTNDIVIAQPGPVQFKMGRSLHRVDTRYIQQSTTLPSEPGMEQGTFADRYDLPYSLIRFHGIVNENAAQDTELTYDDVHKLADGLWNGTRSLITHSKMEHAPVMLLIVEYSEENYHVGGLDKLIDIETEKEDEAIRSLSEVTVRTGDLEEELASNSEKIEDIHVVSNLPASFSVEGVDRKELKVT